jgi:hypothetical protein
MSRTAFSASSECVSAFDLISAPFAVTMSQKPSLPQSLQTVQLVLTGNSQATFQTALYPLDFLALAVLNRSLCLLSGFATLLDSKNLISAAPLTRLQLDNCLRFFASTLVENPHEFA